MASAVAHRLFRCHFKVCVTERSWPLAVRRGVSFCEAVFDGVHTLEGVTARLVKNFPEIEETWARREIPLLIDEAARVRDFLRPHVVVDAILAKRNTGTKIGDAPLVIALGPGFTAGVDAHAVIETNRGHNLGKVIINGRAEEDSGIPSEIKGFTSERVLRAPVDGRFTGSKNIGDLVEAGEVVGWVAEIPVKAMIAGVIRGLIRNGSQVEMGLKLGDIDPRGVRDYCFTISDKARAIAGGVLEAILFYLGKEGEGHDP